MKLLVFEGSAGEIADLLERMPQLNSAANHATAAISSNSANNAPEF